MTTINPKKNAKKIIKVLLKKKLAACIQLFPIESSYTWEGTVNNDKEILLGSLTIFAKDTLLVSSDGEAIRRDGRSRRMTSSSDGNNAKIVKEPFFYYYELHASTTSCPILFFHCCLISFLSLGG